MYRARHLFAPLVNTLAQVFFRLGFSPNRLTITGALFAVMCGGFLLTGQPAVGGVILLISGLFDVLDGAVARLSDSSSKFGAFFDSVMDRIGEAVVLLGLLIFFLNHDNGNILGAVLVYTSLAGSIMVSYVRARAEGLGIECAVGLMQRPERVLALSIGLIIAQWWTPAIIVTLIIITVFTIFTTVQRVIEVYQTMENEKR